MLFKKNQDEYCCLSPQGALNNTRPESGLHLSINPVATVNFYFLLTVREATGVKELFNKHKHIEYREYLAKKMSANELNHNC